MHARPSSWFVVLVLLVGTASPAAADDLLGAAMRHAQGQALLAKADFGGALLEYRAAAKLAPEHPTYAKDAAVLRRVIALRKIVAQPGESAKWEKSATSLHAFYLRNRLHTHAVKLDRRALAALKNAAAEARLAEALLEAGRATEVLPLLATEVSWKRDARHTIFRGLALAHGKRYDDALAVADGLALSADAGPLLLRDAARLEGRLGREAPCAALLVRAFERTPAAQLTALKAQVRAHPDFARVLAAPAFEQAMATATKLAPTSCSGGKDCGSCPSRSGCGKGK